jgi:plastocyanin
MTLRLRTCSSLALAVSLHAATVSGNVSLLASKDKRVRNQRDFSGVVVWLEPSSPAPARLRPQKTEIVQKNKTFIPHVLAVAVGSSVEFPNFDPIFHNAFSNFSGQIFDVGLYPPKTTRSVQFVREGVVRVFCNIHPAMSAVIVVLDTPWFAVTARNGGFRIAGVPPGEYTLKVFHERATAPTLAGLARKITVAGDVTLPGISISEAGYIPLPHKNKYGKEYPAVIEDKLPYAGARK